MTIFHDEIKKLVREYSLNMDHSGAFAPEILEFIYETKLFKLFVPTELDGLGTDLPEALRIFEEASQIDGSFGWLITIGSGGGFFSATLPPPEAKELFTNRKAVIAGSGHPTGTAKPVPGGYQVSGSWKYCSGSTYASFFTANCWIESGTEEQGEGAEREMRSFVFMPEQVEIIKDWKAFGLKATESHTIAVSNIFVPQERTFSITSEPHYDDPVFFYPFLQFAQTSFAAVCIGICRHFLEEAREFALERKEAWEQGNNKRFSVVMGTIEQQEKALHHAAEHFYEAADASWTDFALHRQLTLQDEQRVSHCSQEAARIALACAHTVFPLLGMSVLMEDSLLNRIWRDLHTVTQHTVLVPLELKAAEA
ncbi:acyl-CoA dehydrogenase family protein [Paenibacillus eucommiae]|uniref:Alkylation response protein AidB-like acyl-CoA dehydrogenase n=1 Tax=Paenibacillus eucommiae TaxID=1355755 RepID=A0ABS4JAX8_9BACL|nr:acyl-CoA dehydrogenase family protein [Paenibacillus eucommiae]MBP1997003.1 alkylation response protein AidB-like acyl-CoA dehydrogenase [Paenibacillus eucommiae]